MPDKMFYVIRLTHWTGIPSIRYCQWRSVEGSLLLSEYKHIRRTVNSTSHQRWGLDPYSDDAFAARGDGVAQRHLEGHLREMKPWFPMV